MGAFLIAGLIAAGTVILSILVLFGEAMSDTTGDGGTSAGWVFGSGMTIAGLVLASHWVHIGW